VNAIVNFINKRDYYEDMETEKPLILGIKNEEALTPIFPSDSHVTFMKKVRYKKDTLEIIYSAVIFQNKNFFELNIGSLSKLERTIITNINQGNLKPMLTKLNKIEKIYETQKVINDRYFDGMPQPLNEKETERINLLLNLIPYH
jgi:hypothetical protein